MLKKILLALGVVASLSNIAHAQSVDPCAHSLVMNTYDKSYRSDVDWAMASLVTEKDCNEIKHDASVNTTIYGAPTKGTYSDYQKNIKEHLDSENQSYSSHTIENVQWSLLDSQGSTNYRVCRETQFSSSGLHLYVIRATQSDITIEVVWRPVGTLPPDLPVRWDGAVPAKSSSKAPLPTSVRQGISIVRLGRPQKESQVVLNAAAGGFADSVVLTPLPPPLTRRERALCADWFGSRRDFLLDYTRIGGPDRSKELKLPFVITSEGGGDAAKFFDGFFESPTDSKLKGTFSDDAIEFTITMLSKGKYHATIEGKGTCGTKQVTGTMITTNNENDRRDSYSWTLTK